MQRKIILVVLGTFFIGACASTNPTREIEPAQNGQLELAANYLREARKEGAQIYAPRSFALAMRIYEQANRGRNSTQIDPVYVAKRALIMTQKSRDVVSRHPEETALWLENELESFNRLLNLRDRHDLSFTDQIGLIQTAFPDRPAHLAQIQPNHERWFRRLKREFNNTEADVERTQGGVVVRLKGLTFDSSASHLTHKDYKILDRARAIIGSLDRPEIEIGGHSDQQGSSQYNLTLSKKRADAVKEYFLANKRFQAERLQARGYGSARPIANNQTVSGRSLNRRIEIVLK